VERVFISYVRENSDVVTRLADALEAFGVEVWLDKTQIRPGYRWSDAIRDAIGEGAFFIACFSAEYADRRRSYMNEELTLAIDELRQRPTDQAWFIPVLLNRTSVPDRSIGAGETLQSIQYVALYEDWDAGVQQILSVINPVSGLLHDLIVQLSASSARARIRAADQLGRLGAAAEKALPSLLTLLDDPNETVRAAAADALGNIGVPDRKVILKLLAITEDDRHEYYPSVLANKSLVKMGSSAIPTLLKALGSRNRRASQAAVRTLAEIGDASLPGLTRALESDHARVRAGAMRAISLMSKPGTSAADSPIPGLLRILRQEDTKHSSRGSWSRMLRILRQESDADDESSTYARAAAADALGKLGDPAAVPDLVQALTDPNYLAVSAALALGQIGDAAAVGPLVDVVRDHAKSWVPRGAAAVALGNIGPAAASAVPALREALEYDVASAGEKWDERAHEAVVDALNRIDDPSAQSMLTGKGYRYEMWGLY
jgi:HEAT repeat protein